MILQVVTTFLDKTIYLILISIKLLVYHDFVQTLAKNKVREF